MLALADSVNPCAIAVLTMILLAILMENPKNKNKNPCSFLTLSQANFRGFIVLK